MRKNDRLEVIIEGYSSDGFGVAKPDGYVLFIAGTLKGERVLCHVLKCGKNFGYAKAIEILEPSPERIAPLCRVSDKCGGCGLWHISYSEQLRLKQGKVLSNLKKAGIDTAVDECVPSPARVGYRNKAQYPVRMQNGEICIGFYRVASHTVIEGKCLIQPDLFDSVAKYFKTLMQNHSVTAYDETSHSGTVRHLYMRSSGDLKRIMVCIVVNGEFDKKTEFARLLRVKFPEICTVCINYNPKNTNVVLGDRFETVYGDGYITDTLLGKEFEISPPAFYQVNHAGCEKLYSIVKEYADIKPDDRVLDLYCGIGTIGLCVADNAKSLVGVEIVPEAIENAKRNAQINGITNAEFYTGDAAMIKDIAEGDFDVIIVDPPRKGCDIKTLEFIKDRAPSRVVYVSCDSATLARDLAILQTDYTVRKVTPVDMFPHTSHVECCVQLCRT